MHGSHRELLYAQANARWLRDVAISHNLIGTALARQGKFDEALTSLQQGLAIGQKLVAQDPNNIVWQSDLACSPCHSWADYTISMFEFEFPTETRLRTQDVN